VSFLTLLTGAFSAPAVRPEEKSKYDQWLEHREQVVVDPDVVAYYDFQEGEGDRLKNQAKGNPELNGTIHGATWDAGRWPGKKALKFDGDDYVEIPHSRSLCLFDPQQGGTGELTLEVSLCAHSIHECGLVDKYSEGWGKGAPYALWMSPKVAMGCLGDGGAAQWIRDPVEIPLDTWVHLVFTVDETQMTLYKNGLLVAQAERTLAPVDNGKPLLIGCMIPGKFHFKGLIDEVVLYQRALTEKEVHRHYRTKPITTFFIP
jgi:hypothetical protein